DAVDAEELGRADDDAVARGLHVEDVPGPAVGRRAVDPQTLALADGERVRAVVLAEDGALRVDDLAGCCATTPGSRSIRASSAWPRPVRSTSARCSCISPRRRRSCST